MHLLQGNIPESSAPSGFGNNLTPQLYAELRLSRHRTHGALFIVTPVLPSLRGVPEGSAAHFALLAVQQSCVQFASELNASARTRPAFGGSVPDQ